MGKIPDGRKQKKNESHDSKQKKGEHRKLIQRVQGFAYTRFLVVDVEEMHIKKSRVSKLRQQHASQSTFEQCFHKFTKSPN